MVILRPSLETRLHTVMTPWMNEAFFSDLTVLVEGEEDRAAIMGVSNEMGYNLESMGISVIPCMSKHNIDKLYVIFKEFKIPLYCIWDSDYDNNAEKRPNKKLLALFNHRCNEDWPDLRTTEFSCFKENLGTILKVELGETLFENTLTSFMTMNEIHKRKQALKRVNFIQEVIKEAKDNGKYCKTLEKIVLKIIYLRKGNLNSTSIPEYISAMNLDLIASFPDF